MITSKRIETVLNNFAKVIQQFPKGILNMHESKVNYGHTCGTVHCHGGWYAVAKMSPIKNVIPSFVTYTDGANTMAEDLGFTSYAKLFAWTDSNREIWGNVNGRNMFTSICAFTPGDKSHANNLQDIYDHWAEVHDRLYLEEQLIKQLDK